MGYVSTGLCEDEIIRSLRMVKHAPFNTKHFSTEMDRRCSICQVYHLFSLHGIPFFFSLSLLALAPEA
jgi:hypothetical protein